MGWDGYPDALRKGQAITKKLLDEFFTGYYGWNTNTHTVLATSYNSGVYYEAVKVHATGEVFAAVSLIRRNGTELLVKHMSEESGISDAKPSKKVLDALTPTDNKEAVDWRKRAAANLGARKFSIAVGDVVELDEDLHYQSGYAGRTFTIGRFGSNNYHFIGEDGRHRRAPRGWRDRVITINGKKVHS